MDKISQRQGLLFRPWGRGTPIEKERPLPTSIQDGSVYECRDCGKPIAENDVFWSPGQDKVKDYYVIYSPHDIINGLSDIYKYLLPFYQSAVKYQKENNLSFSDMSKWEVEVPEFKNILSRHSEFLRFVHDLSDRSNRIDLDMGYLGSLILSPPYRITGLDLLRLEDDTFFSNIEDIILKYAKSAKDVNRISANVQQPICPECKNEYLDKCEYCGNLIENDDTYYYVGEDSDSVVCENCIDNYVNCDECGRYFLADNDTEDFMYYGDGTAICKGCFGASVFDAKDDIRRVIRHKDGDVFDLTQDISNTFFLSNKDADNLYSFINKIEKSNTIPDWQLDTASWSKIFYLASKHGLTDSSIRTLNFIKEKNPNIRFDTIVKKINNTKNIQSDIMSAYPGVKNYVNVPYDVFLEEPHFEEEGRLSSGVIAITPTSDFIDYVSQIFDIDVWPIWRNMLNSAHHKNVMAYARFSIDPYSRIFVINNLQKDADFDAVDKPVFSDKEFAAAKYIDKVTKDWDIFLLNYIKLLSKQLKYKCYLTSYEHQKEKAFKLPEYKSKRIYKKTPEQMGFEKEDIDNNVSDLLESPASWREQVYRVAKRVNWFKKIALFPITDFTGRNKLNYNIRILKDIYKSLEFAKVIGYYSISRVNNILDDLIDSKELKSYPSILRQIKELKKKIYDNPAIIIDAIPLLLEQIKEKIIKLENERDNYHKGKSNGTK